MKIESLSSPVDSTPEQKYAQLHRAMENGLTSCKARLDLGRVCIELKKFDEALQLYRVLPIGQEKTHLHGLLKRAGVDLSTPAPAEAVVKQLDRRVTQLEQEIGRL